MSSGPLVSGRKESAEENGAPGGVSAQLATGGRHQITFDPDTHTYHVDGARVVSVTQVIELAGLSDFSGVKPEVLRRAAERGTAVHKALHYAHEGDLDEGTIDPVIVPYLNAEKAFMEATRFQPKLIEHVVYCEALGYIGTLDRSGFMPGVGPVIADYKTGAESESWPVQLAAYVYACVGKYACMNHKRLVVQLKKNGTFNLHWYEQANFTRDFDRFRMALQQVRKG